MGLQQKCRSVALATMTLPVIFRRQARREFYDAGDWYEKERAGLGLDSSTKSDGC